MQGVSIVDEEGKGNMCNKAIKGAAREEASMPCKEKSIEKGKKVKESEGE